MWRHYDHPDTCNSPLNLIEQVSALHASALMRLGKEAFAKPVGGDDCEVTEKVSNVENNALIRCG